MGFSMWYLCQSQSRLSLYDSSHSMRSQQAGNNIRLVFSYIAWKSTVPQWIGDIIIAWFVRLALCMKFTNMMKITVSYATTNYVLCLSLWYSHCIMIVLASSCFISRHLITTNVFISIKFKFKCFIYPTEVYDIIYNLYAVRFWREGGQRSIAYRAVHLNTKTLIHEYGKLSMYHSRILNDIENSTKRKKAKVH